MSGIALATGSDHPLYVTDLSALWVNVEDYTGDAAAHWDAGKLPYIHMMFHPSRQGPYPIIEKIAGGEFDVEIRTWLERIKAYEDTGRRAVLAPYPEMNGNWTSYGVDMASPNPAAFIEAYRYVVWLGKEIGIQSDWCWAPNNYGWGALKDWWPGSEWVDVVGMSCYSFTVPISAETAIMPSVREARGFTDLPVVITQAGALGDGGFKAQWLSDLVDLQVENKIDDYIWFSIDGFAYPDVADFNARTAKGPSFCPE